MLAQLCLNAAEIRPSFVTMTCRHLSQCVKDTNQVLHILTRVVQKFQIRTGPVLVSKLS
jgi:hypothetical protein